MKASLGARLRLSMETPLTVVPGGNEHLPRTAFTISPTVQRRLSHDFSLPSARQRPHHDQNKG